MQVILFTCELFLQAHPGAMVMLSKQDESDAAVEGGERPNLVPTDMFVRCGDDWHSQQLMWEQEELYQMQQEDQWSSIFISMTKGEGLYQMLDGGLVKL
jgi:hypothetical protein